LVTGLAFIMISKRSLKVSVLSGQLGLFLLPYRWHPYTEKFELNPKLVQKSWQSILWFDQVTIFMIVMFACILLVAYFILFDELNEKMNESRKGKGGFQICLCLIIAAASDPLLFRAIYSAPQERLDSTQQYFTQSAGL